MFRFDLMDIGYKIICVIFKHYANRLHDSILGRSDFKLASAV